MSDTLRVMHLITGLSIGGAENQLAALLEAWSTKAIDNIVVSMTPPGAMADRIRKTDTEVLSLDMRKGPGAASSPLKLLRLIRHHQPDILQCWMYHADLLGGMATKISRTPCIWNIRQANLSPAVNKSSTLKIMKTCARLSSRLPAKIITNSHAAMQAHVEAGYATHKFQVIPNGFDASRFQPNTERRAALRDSLGISQEASVIGHVARFDPQKDQQTLLDAIQRFLSGPDDAVFLLIGKDLEEGNATLMKWMEERDLAPHLCTPGNLKRTRGIHLLGSRSDVPDLLQTMDIMALSSIGEAFPNVLGEAMLTEVPCVATDVGDVQKIVGDTGVITATQDPAAMADGWRTLISESASQKKARASACRQRVLEQFDVHIIADTYTDLYQSCLR